MGSELVNADHLNRKAVIYIRQSTSHQVVGNQESLRLQYALCQLARDLGWREADIDVIDADLGLSGAAALQGRASRSRCSRHTRRGWHHFIDRCHEIGAQLFGLVSSA